MMLLRLLSLAWLAEAVTWSIPWVFSARGQILGWLLRDSLVRRCADLRRFGAGPVVGV